MARRQHSKERPEINEEIRPGEISALFIQKMGGKAAFVEDLLKEYRAAHTGSMARAGMLKEILRDAAEAHSRRMSLEDLDDEALVEHLEKIEQKIADARRAEGETGEDVGEGGAAAAAVDAPADSQAAGRDADQNAAPASGGDGTAACDSGGRGDGPPHPVDPGSQAA